jgi:tetratricopeptide (TPR) repeat protein
MINIPEMKKLLVIIILISTGSYLYSQTGSVKFIPVTTSSKSALTVYNEAKKLFDDVKLEKALNTFKEALDKDPDFFMANYQLAMYYYLNNASDNFEEYADAAIGCKAKLSDAEELLKEALTSLKQGNKDVISIGEKLVSMYPGDPEAYNNLVAFKSINGDYKGMVETLQKAIAATAKPAPFYNQLGYAYLALNQGDKAEEAFDKYIELEPDNPNVYDSKGDYYLFAKMYDKAYEMYIKANTMDPSFSKNKAEAAKQLYERTEGKPLEIISL